MTENNSSLKKVNKNEDRVIAKNISNILAKKFESIDSMMIYAQELISKRLIPHTTAESAVNAALLGKEMYLPALFSMNHIHTINAIVRPDIHAKLFACRRAGITLQQIEDFVPLYQYIDLQSKRDEKKDDTVKAAFDTFTDDDMPFHFQEMKEKNSEEFFKRVKKRIIDRRTTWEGIRRDKVVVDYDENGKEIFKIQITKIRKSFTETEAVNADLIKDKSAWDKWKKRMIETKCLHFLIDLIATDVIYGGHHSEISITELDDYVIETDLKETSYTEMTQ